MRTVRRRQAPRPSAHAHRTGGTGGRRHRTVGPLPVGSGPASHHLPVPHVHQALGGLGHVVVVGDQDDGLAAAVQPGQELDDLVAAVRVEGPGRLVGQQQGGLVGQGPGDGQPLALPTGERAGHGLGLVPHPEEVEEVTGPALGRLALEAGDDGRQGHVLQRRHALQQVEELEHDADVAPTDEGQLVLGASR